jgi:hypothetical protein
MAPAPDRQEGREQGRGKGQRQVRAQKIERSFVLRVTAGEVLASQLDPDDLRALGILGANGGNGEGGGVLCPSGYCASGYCATGYSSPSEAEAAVSRVETLPKELPEGLLPEAEG